MHGSWRPVVLSVTVLVAVVFIAVLILFFTAEEAGSLTTSRTDGGSPESAIHRSTGAKPRATSAEMPDEADSLKAGEMVRRLGVLIVDAEGQPVRKAPVLLVDRAGRRWWEHTDEEGRASFEHPGTGHLLVRVTANVPVIRRVTEARSTYVLRLAQGLHIDGRLLIDGNPPGKSLIFSASIFESRLEQRFYAAIRRPAHASDLEPIPLQCDATGAFRIDGLQPGWTVRINLPEGLRMMKGEKDSWRRVYHVETIRSNLDLVLRTVRRTRLVGTCRDVDGRPLAGIPVELRIAFRNSAGVARSPQTYATDVTDDEGLYTLWLDKSPTAMRVASIQVVAIRYGRQLHRDIASTDPKRQVLPDFVFPSTHPLRLQVIGDAAQPIPGASVGTPDGRLIRTTDATGAVTLAIVPGEPLLLHVAARGFAVREAEIVGESEREFTIRLARASRAVFRFQWDDGSPVRGRRFTMSFHGNPFRHPLAFSSPIEAAVFPQRTTSRRGEMHVIIGTTGLDGRVVVDDLRSGASVHVSMLGYGGVGRLLDATRTLAGTDEETITFVVNRNDVAVVGGTVVDERGDPVADAAVLLGEDPNRLGGTAYTDDRGAFVLRDVVFKSAYVRVGKPGFRAVTRFVEDLHESKRALTFRLRPAARCRLRIEDAQGHLLAHTYVALPGVLSPGMGPVVLNKGGGLFEIVDLGDEPCIATVYGPGGAKRRITIRPDVDTLKTVRFD